MSSYELDIQFTAEDTHTFNLSGQRLTLVKEVGGMPGTKVAWLAISPFQYNLITWEDQYGLYASTTEAADGATIYKVSDLEPASTGVIYPFKDGGFGLSNKENNGSTSYGVENASREHLIFGLAQSVTANGKYSGTNPLNALKVINNGTGKFTALEKIHIFLHREYKNGAIISEINSKALVVDLANTLDHTVTIHYDTNSGQFLIGPLP